MLGQLDDYSMYLSPDNLAAFHEDVDLQFAGIGIDLGIDPKTKELSPQPRGKLAGRRRPAFSPAIESCESARPAPPGIALSAKTRQTAQKSVSARLVSVAHKSWQENHPLMTGLSGTREVIPFRERLLIDNVPSDWLAAP